LAHQKVPTRFASSFALNHARIEGVMATAQPTGDTRSALDIRFRSAHKRALLTSLALGIFVLIAVPLHSAFVADPRALVDERYVFAACNWPFPLGPGSACPRVFAGESPFMVLYTLVIVPFLLIRGGAKTILTIAVLSLVFALVQIASPFYAELPSAVFPPELNPDLLPSAFQSDPATCGLVLCGLDHSLFHFSQVPFLLALEFFSYQAYRALTRGARARRSAVRR
jgi:hypothetical protein